MTNHKDKIGLEIEYLLLTKNNKILPIIIQENVKEDFMELMEWDEKKFKKHTVRRFKHDN